MNRTFFLRACTLVQFIGAMTFVALLWYYKHSLPIRNQTPIAVWLIMTVAGVAFIIPPFIRKEPGEWQWTVTGFVAGAMFIATSVGGIVYHF